MAEVLFRVVTDDGRETPLAPDRVLLKDALEDKRSLARPERARIARVRRRVGGAASAGAVTVHGRKRVAS